MYSVGRVIYGLPLHFKPYTESVSEYMQKFREVYEHSDEAPPGVLRYYHGGLDEFPLAFGIELAMFDETDYFLELGQTSFSLEVSPENQEKYQQYWQQLSPEMQEEFSAYGVPRLFILWTSS